MNLEDTTMKNDPLLKKSNYKGQDLSLSLNQLNDGSVLRDNHKDTHTPHIMITDLAAHFDELDELNPSMAEKQFENYNKKSRGWEIILLLFILAIIVPCISVSFVYLSRFPTKFIFYCFKEKEMGNLIYILYVILFSLTMIFISTTISYFFRDTEGSGIPELKSILIGISIYKYLSFKMMIAKIVSLYFATGSGLAIGREGPFVHISAAVANNLSKFRLFKNLHEKNTFRKQILSAAGGIGITATFGAPIGGCLYGIETTSTFFAVGNFLRAFFCAFLCATIYNVVRELYNFRIWYTTSFIFEVDIIPVNIFAFAGLGIICGIFGILHIKFITFLILLRKKIKYTFLNRYLYVGLIVIITLLIIFFYYEFGLFAEEAIRDLFNKPDDYNFKGKWWLLGLFFFRLFMNGLAISCPIPAGIFVPMFLTGAMLGRVYGTFMYEWFGITQIGRFAVVGAASLVSSVTHTLAIAVVAFEVTGQINVLYPTLLGVILSYGISKFFSVSVYHVLVEIKNLPFLPKLLKAEYYKKNASELMEINFPYLTLESHVSDIAYVLTSINFRVRSIPILADEMTMELLFCVQSANLREYLIKEYKKAKKPGNASIFKSIIRKNKATNMLARLESIPPMHQEFLPSDIKGLQEIPASDPFWQRRINWDNKILRIDRSPFTVIDTVNAARIHFLFSMLGLHFVFVLCRGKLVGIISKESFQKNHYI